jgi:hypothetical protein
LNTYRPILIAAAVSVLSSQALALEEHVGRDAEKGDPARWYEPADTPQKKFRADMKEAGAAQAEALSDCRSRPTLRKECDAQAREQYRRDAQAARERLSTDNPR